MGIETSSLELEARRAEILFRLERKVGAFEIMKDRFFGIDPDKTPEEADQILTETFTTIRDEMPEDIQAGFQRFKELYLDKTEISHSDEAEIAELLRNDDIRFLSNASSVTESLRHNSHQVEGLRKSREETLVALQQALGSDDPIHPADVRDIRYGRFEVHVVLSRQGFEKINPYKSKSQISAGGFHITDTPFSVLSSDLGPSLDWASRHESTHMFLDGASDDVRIFDVDALAKDTEDASNTEDVERNISSRQRLKHLSVNNIMDGLHQELLANLEFFEADNYGENMIPPGQGSAEDPFDTFLHYAENTSTAGKQAEAISTLFEKYSESGVDPELRMLLKQRVTQFERVYIRVNETIRTALEVGKKMSQQDPTSKAYTEVHTLLYLLRPSQYRHIQRFLEHKYGADIVSPIFAELAPPPLASEVEGLEDDPNEE